MQKNTASQKWIVFAYGLPGHATPGEPVTGDAANITANIRADGGSPSTVTNTNPSELARGFYAFDITAGESNGNNLLLLPQSSSANVQVIGVPGAVWTRPPYFSDLGISVAGVLAEVAALTGHTAQSGDSYPKVDTEIASLVSNIAAVLVDTSTTLDSDLATIVTHLTDIKGASWSSAGSLDALKTLIESAGSGARTVTITVDDGTTPLENAIIRLTEGANNWRQLTDVNGQATFNLDDATWTVGISKVGYTYAGTTLVVSAPSTPTYSMTLNAGTAPPSAETATLSILCYTEAGALDLAAEIDAQMIKPPTGDVGHAFDSTIISATADGATGIAELTVFRNATYQVRRGSEGAWKEVAIPDAAQVTVEGFIGDDD